jgi:nitrate/TMAO reductase-like tetraheme cytochrome c subunit
MDGKNLKITSPLRKRIKFWLTVSGFGAGIVFLLAAKAVMNITSTDKYCISCHIHPSADQSWKLSTHFNNKSGTIVHCVECHLPPAGHGYLFAKAKHGLKDAYGYFIKDSSAINWEKKKLLESAKAFVYENSCLKCHENLFPVNLSVDGGNAHLFYTTSNDPLNCINCHLNVGHYDKYAIHAHDSGFGVIATAIRPSSLNQQRLKHLRISRKEFPRRVFHLIWLQYPEELLKWGVVMMSSYVIRMRGR